jgi:hypothetical protein
MNERIKELAVQAKLGSALLLHHFGTIDALTDSEQEDLGRLKKFAELIVKECFDVVINDGRFHDANGIIRAGKGVAMEHFGIEE